MAVIRWTSSTVTAAAAGDYAAGDVISASATNNAGTATSFQLKPSCMVIGASAICSEDSVTTRLRLHLFKANPAAAEVEMDDNAAFAITTSTNYLGFFDLGAFADVGGVSQGQNMTVRQPLVLEQSAGIVYVVVQALDAEASETASMTIRIDMYFIDQV